ncbi:MAG: hypothetical protein P8Y70_14400 [Candidatus Lokiarchaeota archaeon]
MTINFLDGNANKALLILYFKKDFKSIKGYLTIALAIGAVFLNYIFVNIILKSSESSIPNLDQSLFWYGILVSYRLFGILIAIILAFDLISNDFSKNTSMALYSILPRKTYLLRNYILLLIHLAFLELISFITFDIVIFLFFQSFLNFTTLIMGFLYMYIYLSFVLTLTFCISTLTKRTFLSIMIPFVYFFIIDQILPGTDLHFLSYSYYVDNISLGIQNLLFGVPFLINSVEMIWSLIIFFSLPVILFLISIFGFQYQDIKTSR